MYDEYYVKRDIVSWNSTNPDDIYDRGNFISNLATYKLQFLNTEGNYNQSYLCSAERVPASAC